MEIKFYPINEEQLYAVNLKLHVTELMALHYDNLELFKKVLVERIIKESTAEAEKILKKKLPEND
jgi:hypothetical protein